MNENQKEQTIMYFTFALRVKVLRVLNLFLVQICYYLFVCYFLISNNPYTFLMHVLQERYKNSTLVSRINSHLKHTLTGTTKYKYTQTRR